MIDTHLQRDVIRWCSSVDALSKKEFFNRTISKDDFLTAIARSDYKIRYQLDLNKDLDTNINELFFRSTYK